MKIIQNSDKALRHGRLFVLFCAVLVVSSLFLGQWSRAKTVKKNAALPVSGLVSNESSAARIDSGSEHAVSSAAHHQPAVAAAGDAQPPPEPSPLGESLSHGDDDGISVAMSAFLRMIVVLAGVLLLAYLLLHKGLGKLNSRLTHGRLIRVIDRVGLEPKKVLYVIEVADHHYLIGASEAGLSHLATLDDAQSLSAFSALLNKKEPRKADKIDVDINKLQLEPSGSAASATVSEKGAKNA